MQNKTGSAGYFSELSHLNFPIHWLLCAFTARGFKPMHLIALMYWVERQQRGDSCRFLARWQRLWWLWRAPELTATFSPLSGLRAGGGSFNRDAESEKLWEEGSRGSWEHHQQDPGLERPSAPSCFVPLLGRCSVTQLPPLWPAFWTKQVSGDSGQAQDLQLCGHGHSPSLFCGYLPFNL